MATTPEGKIKAKIKAVLKKHNVYYFMPMGGQFGKNGVPDFICCANGMFLSIEAKAYDKEPTDLQRDRARDITDAGGIALHINATTINEFDAVLTTMLSE